MNKDYSVTNREMDTTGENQHLNHANDGKTKQYLPGANLDKATSNEQSDFSSFYSNKLILPGNTIPFREFSKNLPKQPLRQPSLNTFESFSSSVLDLPNIITSKDFDYYMGNYKNLLRKSSNFRNKLMELSMAANEFGNALDDCINQCPKVNNSKMVNDGLINAGGLQYILASNNQILSRLILNSFEKPLQAELDKILSNYEQNYKFYQQEIKIKTKLLHDKELENIKLSKQKTRNLHSYKTNLLSLTNQLDEIDRLKYDYYHEINSMIENFNQRHLLIRTGSLVRAQLELFESMARKGWSGGGLDELLAVSPDLFDTVDDVATADVSNDVGNATDATIDTTKKHNLEDNISITTDPDATIDTIKANLESNSIQMESKSATPETSIDKILGKNLSTNIDTETNIDANVFLPVVNNSNSLANLLRNSTHTSESVEPN